MSAAGIGPAWGRIPIITPVAAALRRMADAKAALTGRTVEVRNGGGPARRTGRSNGGGIVPGGGS